MSRIEAGVSSGLVVTHVDRFGRSLLAGLQVIEAGRLACQILLSTADTSFRFRQAVREGIHHGRRIGQLAATRYLRPAHRRQTVAFKR